MKKVPLTQGWFAVVDDADYESVSKFKWHAHPGRSCVYARGWIGHKKVFMHKFLMPGTAKVDHENGDGLNNQRANLRPATVGQNRCNARLNKDNTSGFKGVTWDKRAGKWRATIRVQGKLLHLGLFDYSNHAAKVRDIATRKWHGKFARLNFPNL